MSSIVTTATATATASSGIFGYIKSSKATKAHKAWLEAKGYTVGVEEINGEVYYKTEVTEFVQALDISKPALKELVERRAVMSYKTKGRVEDKVVNGLQLCWALGPVSALVMKTEDEVRGVKAPKTAHRFDF